MSSRSIIGIRTNKWTVNEQRVFDALLKSIVCRRVALWISTMQ